MKRFALLLITGVQVNQELKVKESQNEDYNQNKPSNFFQFIVS